MNAPIAIDDYNLRWPERFESIRDRIAPALGPIAAAIEHIGSTAVPGLASKPIIDLDVLLRSDADLPAAISKLGALGYEHRGDLGVSGRHAFKAPSHDVQHHLYVCLPSAEEYSRHIAFRNHLRAHPKDANVYSSLKRSLAQRFPLDRDAYTHAKTQFVQEILRRTKTTEPSAKAARTMN
ncbi:MAG TPA: GrpB family protein [Terriglobales bacterium]|nr:GrpB family protein [Terriglobales bacterium]HTZ84865.1 GrpB family protein [Candidatus Acidoferrales bacterium]